MKTSVRILFCIIVINIFAMTIAKSQSELNIKILDNPAPGYLNFDWVSKTGFVKLDNSGNLVGSEKLPPIAGFIIVLKNGNIAIYAGNMYNIYDKNLQLIDSIKNPTNYLIDSHDFIQLQNGNYLMLFTQQVNKDMSSIVEGGNNEAILINNILVEVNHNGEIIWTWNALEHYNILDVTSDIDLKQKTIDFTHINSLEEDQFGNILVSARNLDEVSLINKSTGDFIWRLGGSSCKNNQFTYINDAIYDFEGFSHQHTAKYLDNGNILIYDNGNLRSPQFSRAVEYSIDVQNKKITKIWEFRNTPDNYNHAMGSAFRLPNGNTLICWSNGVITEVRPDKSKTFEVEINSTFPIYRAYKIYCNLSYASRSLTGNSEYDFNNTDNITGVKVNVTNFAKSSVVNMQKHLYSPILAQYADTIFSEVLPYRWVFTPDAPTYAISGTFKLKLSTITGFYNPNKLVIYKRDNESSGIFNLLNTSYSSSTNELSANFTGFGEFVVTSIDLEKPVLSTPVNNSYITSSGNIKWNKVRGANSYFVQLSTNENFPENLTISGTSNTLIYYYTNLLYSSKYFWRVRSMNIKDTSEWSNVNVFYTELPKPELINPTDNRIGVKLSDSLKWKSVSGAANYQIQISLTSKFIFPNIEDKFITQTEYPLNELKNYVKYFWRIRAFKGSDSSSWSDIYIFTTTIASPFLSSPLNNQSNIAISHRFTWTYVGGADNYLFQISEQSDFSSLFLENYKVPINELLVENLSANSQYYWRVKSLQQMDSSEWSETFQFFTLLDPPDLIYPTPNLTKVVVNPELSWNKNDKYIYHLQLSSIADFNELIIDNSDLSNSKFQASELKPNTGYYWRVKVKDGIRESNWSDISYFTTNVAGKFLTAPKLLSPERDSDGDQPVDFNWNKKEGAIKYKFQISKSFDFSHLIADSNNLIKSNLQMNKFEENITYYWRVKAFSKYDSSAWSDVWNFRIIDRNRKITLTIPSNDELQIPIIGKLVWKTVSEVDFYNIQLSEDIDFINIIDNKDVYNINYFNYSNLTNNKQYYWRARFSINSHYSEWSEIWSFTTATSKVLNTTKVLTPATNTLKVPISGEITWEPVEGAKSYMISISTENNFSTYLIKVNNVTETKVKYNDLEYGTTYYLRVSAFNDTSSSIWSVPVVFLTELEPPKITTPIDKSKDINKIGQIQWSIKNDLYFYNIQIDTVNTFENPVIDKMDFDDLSYDYNLEESKSYYVRVRSYNDSNDSQWSKIIKFTTSTNISGVDGDYDNMKIKYYPNPAINTIIIEQMEYFVSSDIEIYNLIGEFKLKYKISQGINTIDVSELSNGIYFLKYNNKYYKFVKE